ncbi:hypothetical protein [Jannaschia sp. CCS1]|uniref:hypothetical protein n=1 Tax=Jannaschia sp. (strain CCS1) TaxID=290400 RepID=UPI000053AFDE|nr:hypothetical protein [Jannaschia sp. CCS1]ABD56658.1 hypothetical protein Jann_3741 [Jannaschia sp. CCS1]
MKDAPFQITTTLMLALGVSLIAGGILGALLSSMGMIGFWGIFLTAFLPVPIGSVVRQAASKSAAEQAGVKAGDPPMAFSLPIRLAIGAVVAAGVAAMFNSTDFYTLGLLLGAVAALMTSAVLILVFFLKVSMSK